MQFFGRTEEIKRLQNQLSAVQSQHESRMVCLMGRRRVGKTTLLLKAFENKSCLVLYLYVPNRCTLNELVRAWLDQVVEIFKLPFPPAVQTPTDVLQVVMHLSKDAPCVIIIDECQELNQMDPAFWGKLQELWDRCRQSSRTLLVMSGSIISALEDIFGNNSKPLYGRLNDQMMLMPFGPSDMCTIMGTLAPLAFDLDLLTVYAMTGGVAKYIELLDEAQCLTQEKAVSYFFSNAGSWLRSEGERFLSNEFRFESPIYMELLRKIARGRSKWTELQDGMDVNITAYLRRLETFRILRQKLPFGEQKTKGSSRWVLCDPYFIFWLRFVDSIQANTLESLGQSRILSQMCLRELPTLLGRTLEEWFRQAWLQNGQWLHADAWWDRKGQNEIDLVATNPLTQSIGFAEVKLNPAKFSAGLLELKIGAFLKSQPQYRDWNITRQGLSLEDLRNI